MTGGIADRLPIHEIAATGLIENQVKSARLNTSAKDLAAFRRSNLTAELHMIERLDAVAHLPQRLGELDKHRLQGVRLPVVVARDCAEYSHRDQI